MSTISVHNLSVTYSSKGEKTQALRDISIEFTEGSIYAIMGPSGSGKSTLLHTIGGIIRDYKGEVKINGVPSNPKIHSIGLVPQNYGLLPWKNVRDNIYLPVKIKKLKVSPEESEEIIHTLNLEELLYRYPHELSGGQQQRIALARSFIQKPDILLMDEPFAALDTITSERCRNLFLKVWKEHKVTTLFVTHNIEEAVIMGKYLVFLGKTPAHPLRIIENPLMQSQIERTPQAYFDLACEVKAKIINEWA